ncbi:MAG: hypothetical protein JSR97_09640 [Verrucomicrobia bacterium]|nr:hypothetical protein [Verrucomicrobiota bacterium]
MLKWGLAFIITACIVGWFTFHQTSQDDATLRALTAAANFSEREKAGGLVSYCQQFREGVSKEILFREGPPRYCRILSRDSELFLFRQEKDIEVVEELDGVRCILQEELYFDKQGRPMQTVHTLDAERACYDYTTQTLTASDALVRKYQLPGHELTEDAQVPPKTALLMTAKAKHVTLHLYDHDYDLKAKGLTLVMEDS